MIVDFLLTVLFFTLAAALTVGAIAALIVFLTWLSGTALVFVLLFLFIVAVSAAWYVDFRSNPFTVLFTKK